MPPTATSQVSITLTSSLSKRKLSSAVPRQKFLLTMKTCSSPSRRLLFHRRTGSHAPPVPGVDDQLDPPSIKIDQPEVYEMNLWGGKKIFNPPCHKEKGKISQLAEGSRAMKPPKEILLSGPSKDKALADYNILAHLKRIPSRLSVYGALILSKELH